MSPLIEDLKQRGITLEAKLRFKSETPLTPETAALLREHKAQLLLELVQTELAKSDPSAALREAQLARLRTLCDAGRLDGMKLELPGRFYPDLGRTLRTYYSRPYLRDAELEDLAEIAALVCRLPFWDVS